MVMSIWGVRETYLRHTIYSCMLRRIPMQKILQQESQSVTSKNSLNQSNDAFALKTNELPTTLPPMSEENKALEEPLLKVDVAESNAVGDN